MMTITSMIYKLVLAMILQYYPYLDIVKYRVPYDFSVVGNELVANMLRTALSRDDYGRRTHLIFHMVVIFHRYMHKL
jgi:hypothetical protein